MSIVVFILLGLIAGYVALGLFKSTGKGVVLDFGLGVIGAVIAGSLFNHIAATSAAGLNIASALVTARPEPRLPSLRRRNGTPAGLRPDGRPRR